MRPFILCLLLCCAAPVVALADSININSADAATLDRALKGVGATRAAAIVAYRKEHGPFRSIDELALVQGIGQKVIEDNRGQMHVGGTKPAAAPAPGAKRVAPAKPPAR
ncbi:MAG: ComEA family DNA-binding protein [Steroidobacteraceae bacterium]